MGLKDFLAKLLHGNQNILTGSRYNFYTLDGINSIPVRTSFGASVTEQLEYKLLRKAGEYEDTRQIELAIACLRKANELMKVSNFQYQDEFYALVKLLAREGRIQEAEQEKGKIDAYLSHQEIVTKSIIQRKTISPSEDLVIMDAHGSTCEECAKYQGRVYSISGNSTIFPKVPDFYFDDGVHPGCSHNFGTYIHGVTDPMLEYALEVHPLKNKKYGKNIISFSNRPFVDDRTDECVAFANANLAKRMEELNKRQYYKDHMIEIEAERGKEARDFLWLQQNVPEKCPKSLSGYRRMKTQNTKNYQLLKQLAAEYGRKI